MAHASLSPHPDPAAAGLARRRVLYGEASCHSTTRTAASSGCGDDDDDYTWRKWQEVSIAIFFLRPTQRPLAVQTSEGRSFLDLSRGPGGGNGMEGSGTKERARVGGLVV